MSHSIKKLGFTIIELMLAMSFVSLLLVAVAMTVIQISNIYNRGIILKDVNQAGRALVSELQQSIAQTSAFDVGAGNTINYRDQSGIGGRLCTGQYSYIWNYANAANNDSRNKYDGLSKPNIYFIKIFDPTLIYCTLTSLGGLSNVDPDKGAIEIFSDSQHNLALHSFKITSGVNDAKTNQRLYNIEFVLGTSDTGAIDSGSNTCKPPSEEKSDFTYCSINQFNLTVRSGNAID